MTSPKQVMSMLTQNDHSHAKMRSLFLTLLMLLSSMAVFATTASASVARNYTTNRDPMDVAIGDFDCDGYNDMAIATDGTHSLSILYNDGQGNFNERQDIWVSGNQSRNADWDEFANVEMVEVGEFTGDNAIDIVIYQKNNPFKTNDQGVPAGEPGNITVIENGGCSNRDWTIGERFSHFWVWDMTVGDADQDGDDDIFVLDLLADITTQRVVNYRGPITSSTNGFVTTLGSSQSNTYRTIKVGDYGETNPALGCNAAPSTTDDDIYLLRSEGIDYSTGQVTNPGNDDNISIIEFDCTSPTGYPLTYSYGTNQARTHTINMGVTTTEDFAIADIGGVGYIDTIAVMDSNLENVSYKQASSVGTFGNSKRAYFGPYISWVIDVADLNGDGEPDFVNPTIAFQQNTTDSAGGSTSSFWLNFPTTVQVTLSNGNGGHVSPLSYPAGRRPSAVAIGQLQGGSSSALDLVVGHTNYFFGGWRDNFGWSGQYDTITVVEMDNKDLAITDLEISPTDRFFGVVGEGSRNINVTVTNTGMDTLNGQTASLDVVLKVVDEANSTNSTVYANDWDTAEDKTGCGSGCSWTFEEYVDGATAWHLETNHSVGASDGNNDPNVSANYLNPTDFMWAGNTKTNSSGGTWTGYGKNWDDAMVLNDVDLTGADRAFMSVELFRHLGLGALGNSDGVGFIVGDVWDDLAIVEIGSDETGWSLIGCPQLAAIQGACASGASIWGGFDNDRLFKMNQWGAAPENIVYYGLFSAGTYYGWDNFTEEDLGAFDLSFWAGQTVDIRFRFRTGFVGSTADDNQSRWSGRDGFAVDNLTIWKQTTAFMPGQQTQSTTIGPLNNLQPGQEYTTSIQANLLNNTIYRISATLSNNAWDQQSINDDVIGYVRPFNLYDPTVESIEFFKAGGLYAEGIFDIGVVTNNYGNTAVDFDIQAIVYSATPSDVYCGTPSAVCIESFEGGTQGYRYEENQQPKGAIYNENTCSTKIFNNNAYWFGHPCDTATNGYDDAWANETLTIPNIDLTSMSGDFVSLNFEYYADTFYTIDQNGNIDPSDYTIMTVDYNKAGTQYTGLVYAQWNDYNEDGTCQNDDDGNGIINATESIDSTELQFIGDASNVDGTGNYNVFFNSDELVKTASIDLTHLYILNRTSSDSSQWRTECMSLQGSRVDINFAFQSDDDGRNGINDGFKGVGFNNISLQEYTFVQDATYTTSRTNVDAEDAATTVIASHEFTSGVYRLDVKTVFDNTTMGKPWYNDNELSTANNIERVIFNVESVDISIGKPDTLACHADQTLACVLPIDSALTHSWEFQATNGVLGGNYIFYMEVTDMADGSQAHLVDSGPAKSLQSQEKTLVSFTPWNGWLDGHTYNISFYGRLSDGSETGNVRYFHATFANQIDVAILSDTSTRTTAIKQDLSILGMTYTQFEINDWNTYFDAGWFTHYNKIVLPWQEQLVAKDTQFGGSGYYQYLGEPARRTVLENFMSAGGTIQAHLGPLGSQIYGLDQGLNGRLPFGLDIQSRDTTQTQVTYNTMDLADPYHPIMDNININSFQGFDANSAVAQAVLNTKSVSTTNVPGTCNGYMEDGGYFQRLIRSTEDIQDTVLGVCSYYSGGMIISTIDVATHSDRADSTTFPLLGNLLQYQVTPYPDGFGTLGDGLDLTINGAVPGIDPSTGKYALRHMKSDATLNFGFTTSTSEALLTDWIIDGPTNWDGSTLANGVTGHTSDESPVMTFCKADLASQTGCAQGEQWDITLMLHDEFGHARTIDVTVETNDVYADEFRPEAAATIDMRPEYASNVEFAGTKTVSNIDWDVYEITLQGEGEAGELVIHFDASNSSDADALDGNGIETYEWKVLFDAPYGDNTFNLDGHTFTQGAGSGGLWSYKFRNVTVDPTGTTVNQIRMELVVYDSAGKFSEKFRMYFVILPEGFGDEEPIIQWDNVALDNKTKYDGNTITLSGTVLSGAETSEVFVEAAFFIENFSASSSMKYKMSQDGLWGKAENLGDGEKFEITLNLDDFYSNKSETRRIYIKYYEGESDQRWVTIKWIEVTLPRCHGLEPDPQAEAAGGEFVLDANGDCQWNGAWSYDPVTGEWKDNTQTNDDTSGAEGGIDPMLLIIGVVVLLVVIGGSLMFMRKGGEKVDAFGGQDGGFGADALDPTEQYVQQLIAQGYPEETARAFAAQYVGGAAGQAAAQPAAAQPAAGGYDQAIYNQYYQQFVAQGYDPQTSAAYAQQYAIQYAQSQG